MRIINLVSEREDEILLEIERVLKGGGVAIVPTDTVYGLICDGLNEKAKKRIYEIKGRSLNKPLIGFVDSIEKVEKFAEVRPEKIDILKDNWPGAVTFILKAKKPLSHITTKTSTIAFRIPDNEFLLKLIKKFDILASTSANISGEKSPCSIDEIPDSLKEKVDIIIDSGATAGAPSCIWDITGRKKRQLR